jgi:hypothetical protein
VVRLGRGRMIVIHRAAAAAVGQARADLGGRHQAITGAALRYAEGVMAWHRGEPAAAEHLIREATVQWHHGGDRMAACDGIELPGVLAAARERHADAARLLAAADAARRLPRYLAPGFTAARGAAARAAAQARQALGDDRSTQAWEQGQALAPHRWPPIRRWCLRARRRSCRAWPARQCRRSPGSQRD